MLPKFEYDNLYKFVVSLGVLLASAAVALPLLLLRSSASLRIPRDELDQLTPTAQNVITAQQQALDTALEWAPSISVVLLIAGVGLSVYGLRQWKRRQADLDAEQTLANRERQLRIEAMTPQEIEQKQAAEVARTAADARTADQTRTQQREQTRPEGIEALREAEGTIAGLLLRAFGHDYDVRANVRASNARWDVILLPRQSSAPSVGIDIRLFSVPLSPYFDRRIREIAATRRSLDPSSVPTTMVAIFVFAEDPGPEVIAHLDKSCRRHEIGAVAIVNSALSRMAPVEIRALIIDALNRPGSHLHKGPEISETS